MEWFLRSNNTWARLLRTIAQGLLGVLIAEAPELIAQINVPDYVQGIIVAVVMAILSAAMSELGKYVESVAAQKRFAQDSLEDAEEVKARGVIK